MMWTVALCLFLAYSAKAFVLNGCNSHCEPRSCPTACHSQIPDPCSCCPFICAAAEGEPCGTGVPCDSELACRDTNNGRLCSCIRDERMICGSDSTTYASICQFNKANKAGNLSIHSWEPCQFKPEIVSGPDDRRIKIGEPLAMDCEAKGYPIPTISWTFTARDGTIRQLPSDDELIAVQLRGGPEQLMVTSWVQIVESRPSDLGFYTCVAKNILGSAQAEAGVSHYRT